jgi:hypothetical protein
VGAVDPLLVAPVDCPRLAGLRVRELGDGRRIAEAGSRKARTLGLARLDALPSTAALHLPRCRSVHTFAMRFALDLIWLDGQGGWCASTATSRPGACAPA